MLALVASLAGCGGGGSTPTSNLEPIATQPLELAQPAVAPNPPPLAQPTQPTPAAPVPAETPAVPTTPEPLAPNGATTSASSCSLVNFQADVMSAINAARAQPRSCGTQAHPAVARLAWNETLFAAAEGHSKDMAQRNYFAHTSPDGKTAADRAQTSGYRFTTLGENIAAGQPSVAVVMQGWLASEGHCRNVMNPTFTQVAVACVGASGQQYPTYWTMMLGKPP